MKQDKYNPSIYWHGGKMYFTGGGMPLMQGAMGGESVQSDPNNQIINGSMQAGTSLATGNPMGLLAAAPAYIGGIASNVKDVASNPDSSLLDKGLSAVSPLAGMILGGNAREKRRDMATEKQSRDEYAVGTKGISSDAHIYAYGGNFAQGGITPRLTEFNEGGSHEQNADGGVAQGTNTENGEPNLVEQGETKFKDYIFSDRLTMPNAREYNLVGHLNGLTFAAISKKLSKSIEERPNDPISKAGQDKALERLRMANDDAIEEKKFSDENESYKCGGMMKMSKKNKFEYGGYTFTDI